jgi:exonuclease SbcC
MRPLELQLDGFLSYSEPTTLDLSQIHAGVILGDNGAGKTALVEAMSWALFGKGRGRGPDDFVNSRATSCRVSFTFDLDGTAYRVERQRTAGRNGKSTLMLTANGSPIGAPTVGETQEAIEALLGMGHEEWMNTVFVAQGKADSFTALRPAERKQLLFDVLGLGIYDAASQIARDSAKEADGRRSLLSRQLEEHFVPEAIDTEGIERPLREASAILEVEECNERDLRERLAKAEVLAAGVSDLQGAITMEELRLTEDRRSLYSQHTDAVERRMQVIRRREKLQRSLEEANAVALTLDDLPEQIAQAKRDEASHTAAFAESGVKLEALRDESASLCTQIAVFQAAIADGAKRLIPLRDLAADDLCPTCSQQLSATRKVEIVGAIELTIDHQTEELDTLTATAHHLANEIAHLKTVNESDRRNMQDARALADRLEIQRDTAELAFANLESVRDDALAASDEQAALDRTIKEQEAALAQWNTGPVTSAALTKLREDLAVASKAAEDLRNSEAVISGIAGRVAELRAEHQRLSRALDDAVRVNELRAQAQQRAVELQTQVAAATAEASESAFLAEAFGRDGIPTLIVENAIPQIEDSANRLLDRFSDGRFQVSLQTQAAKKTGGLKETLDILVIADGSERELEKLSGGEQQRVNLALRFGIAELLMHRAGTRIGTLIMDEAFTALDASGRQRAVEIVRALTDEFATVLFITHQAELADVFSSQIRVTGGGPRGSLVEVDA